MNPGRELDAKIHDKIFGQPGWYHFEHGVADESLPHYSTDIADAWLVVEKMKSKSFELFLHSTVHEEISASFNDKRKDKYAEFKSKTAPHAISLAALKACGVEA